MPPRSTPMTRLARHERWLPYPAGWRTEKSPTGSTRAAGPGERCQPRLARERQPKGEKRASEAKRPPSLGPPDRARRALALGVLLVVWFVLGYLSFRGGVEEANARLPKTAKSNLAPQDGMLISKPSLILLLGTDGDKLADARRSDSILLLRTDPSRHRHDVSLDPSRSPRRDPRLRSEQDQRGLPARRPRADAQDGHARSPACSRITSC